MARAADGTSRQAESAAMSADPDPPPLIVHGRVQGVFFRDSTRECAERHGVAGWVRNRDDGTVEALLEGPAEAVQAVDRLLLGRAPRAPTCVTSR